MAHPCSACFIADGLMRGLIMKVAGQYADVEARVETLSHPRELAGVEGLEVEKLPALIIGDEQVTAGGILHRRQLAKLIDERM